LALKGEAEDWGAEGRLELWSYAFQSISEKPFLGTGIGTLWKGLLFIGGVDNYHNIYLQMWAQVGFIGFILFLFWSFYLFRALFFLKKYFPFLGTLLLLNVIIYYIKSFLMFQYFDAEIWTLIGVASGLYLLYVRKVCGLQK